MKKKKIKDAKIAEKFNLQKLPTQLGRSCAFL
jgi:hypothetical protein